MRSSYETTFWLPFWLPTLRFTCPVVTQVITGRRSAPTSSTGSSKATCKFVWLLCRGSFAWSSTFCRVYGSNSFFRFGLKCLWRRSLNGGRRLLSHSRLLLLQQVLADHSSRYSIDSSGVAQSVITSSQHLPWLTFKLTESHSKECGRCKKDVLHLKFFSDRDHNFVYLVSFCQSNGDSGHLNDRKLNQTWRTITLFNQRNPI